MTLELPRSELVPGMIQFIHRPEAGYTAPAWPDGSGTPAASAPSPDGQWATERDASLAVGLSNGHLATVSQSSAPVTAVVTASDGTVVKRLRVTPNGIVVLALPTGTYTACLSQTAAADWDAAGGCATASWRAPVSATVSLGRPHRSGRRLAVPVSLGPRRPLSLAAPGAGVVAEVRIRLQRSVGAARAGAASTRTVYTRAWRLRAGEPGAEPAARRRGAAPRRSAGHDRRPRHVSDPRRRRADDDPPGVAGRPFWATHQAGRQSMILPPAMSRVTPVIHADAFEARNRVAAATSPGRPMRPSGNEPASSRR